MIFNSDNYPSSWHNPYEITISLCQKEKLNGYFTPYPSTDFSTHLRQKILSSPHTSGLVIHICMDGIILLFLLDSPGNRQHYIIEKLFNSKPFSFIFPGPQIHYIQKTRLSSWSYTLCNTGFTHVNPKGKASNWDQSSLLCCRTRTLWGTGTPLWCAYTELYFHDPWAVHSLCCQLPFTNQALGFPTSPLSKSSFCSHLGYSCPPKYFSSEVPKCRMQLIGFLRIRM